MGQKNYCVEIYFVIPDIINFKTYLPVSLHNINEDETILSFSTSMDFKIPLGLKSPFWGDQG